jgi:hypothetical protein
MTCPHEAEFLVSLDDSIPRLSGVPLITLEFSRDLYSVTTPRGLMSMNILQPQHLRVYSYLP